ncbi:MAG: single-stranded-DNA-specific exonuclease RecJ [Methanothermobacter wolfeii]|nr:single-stranded-DNA-specific exonuclease RecJ [Methanothermobacter wolfeii]
MDIQLKRGFSRAREMIESSENVTVYSHTDCDGISAATILMKVLERLGKDHEINIININEIPDIEPGPDLTVFADLGSGQRIQDMMRSGSRILILDHHPPLRKKDFTAPAGELLELNPLFYGMDGSTHISGGGMAYLLAREFGYRDLSWIGLLAAVGDMQNITEGAMVGLNREILHDSMEAGVESWKDLTIYGRHTRPIVNALSYFGDVTLPTTNNPNECIARLRNLGIPLTNGDFQRRLCDLTDEEKKKLFREIYQMMVNEVPERYQRYIPRLILGEVYELSSEEKYSPFRDLTEFSTAVNACNRNHEWELAVEIIGGDREGNLERLQEVLRDHRAYLAETMERIIHDDLIRSMENLQYFHAPDVKVSVTGTIAGMILSYGDWRKPMIGFSETGDGLKVSLRCSRLLAFDGIHFGSIIRKVAGKVGGSGGGHATACGAYIPAEKDSEFLRLFNRAIENEKVNK